MANHVETKYLSFFTKSYWEKRNEEDYNDAKFNAMYQASPGRMTPEQIRAHGYDIARSRMWSQYIETKYNSLWCNEIGMANAVAHQIEEAINGEYPNIKIEVEEGKVKKYGENKVRFPKIYVGDCNDNVGLCITPTLDDKDDNYLSVRICVDEYDKSFYMDDIQMMNTIGKLMQYIQTKEMPIFGIDKVYNRCENQYTLCSGDNRIELYDTEMVNLYHTLSKEINAQYGTNFPYSDKVIKKLYKCPTWGNIQYTGKFYVSNVYPNRATLKYGYFYEDDKTKEPTFGCTSTYGEWSKEELIHLLEVLKPYVQDNYFFNMSQQSLGKKYGNYDRIGIRYDKKPDYFDVLLWED